MIRHKIVLLAAAAAVVRMMAVVALTYIEKQQALVDLKAKADLHTRRSIASVTSDAYHMAQMVHQTGDRERLDQTLRESIMGLRVGKSGYVAVLDGSGEDMGDYIISYKGQLGGENILNARDQTGRYFVKEMLEKSRKSSPGEFHYTVYPWQNKGNPAPRDKIAASLYFADWDWVITAIAYIDDFDDLTQGIEASLDNLAQWTLLGGIASTAITILIALILGHRIGHNLEAITQTAEMITQGDIDRRLDFKSRDEVGQLADAFRQLIYYIRDIAQSADRLSQGDLNVKVTARSDGDVLSHSFERLAGSMHGVFSRLAEYATDLNEASQARLPSPSRPSRAWTASTNALTPWPLPRTR